MREPITIHVDGRTYILRQPSIADLSSYKRAVRRAGGRQVALGDKLLLIEAGLKSIGKSAGREDPTIADNLAVVADAKARLIEFLNEMQAGAFAEATPAEFVEASREALNWSPELTHIASVVEQHYPPYADALADAEVYPEIAARVALELFLEDTAGDIFLPVVRSMGRVSEETINDIPMSDLPLIYARFSDAIRLSEDEKKGSPSPISGGASLSSSEATSTAPQKTRSAPKKPSTSPRSSSGSSRSTLNGRQSPAMTS